MIPRIKNQSGYWAILTIMVLNAFHVTKVIISVRSTLVLPTCLSTSLWCFLLFSTLALLTSAWLYHYRTSRISPKVLGRLIALLTVVVAFSLSFLARIDGPLLTTVFFCFLVLSCLVSLSSIQALGFIYKCSALQLRALAVMTVSFGIGLAFVIVETVAFSIQYWVFISSLVAFLILHAIRAYQKFRPRHLDSSALPGVCLPSSAVVMSQAIRLFCAAMSVIFCVVLSAYATTLLVGLLLIACFSAGALAIAVSRLDNYEGSAGVSFVLAALFLHQLPSSMSHSPILIFLCAVCLTYAFIAVPSGNQSSATTLGQSTYSQVLMTYGFAAAVLLLIIGFLPPSDHSLNYLALFAGVVGLRVIFLQPNCLVRLVLTGFSRIFCPIKVIGAEHIPHCGGALIVCNHVSYLDGIIISSMIPRMVRYMVYKRIYDHKTLHWLFTMLRAIPIKGSDPIMVGRAIERARHDLMLGEVVCIFAEGAISRTHHLMPFKRGVEKIAHGLPVPIIAMHLDGLHDSWFAMNDHPKQLHYRRRFRTQVTLTFSEHLPPTTPAWLVRQKVQELACHAQAMRLSASYALPQQVLRRQRKRLFARIVSYQRYSNLRIITTALLVARQLKHQFAQQTEIGIMLEPSMTNILINYACALSGLIAVNVPIACNRDQLEQIKNKAGTMIIFSSRSLLKNKGLQVSSQYIEANDYIEKQSAGWRRAVTSLSLILPVSCLVRFYGRDTTLEQPLAVLFYPVDVHSYRGVVLSQMSVLASCDSLARALDFETSASMLAILSTSNAYGYIYTFWFPLLVQLQLAFVTTPIDIAALSKMMRRLPVKYLLAHRVFFEHLLKSFKPYDLSGLKYPISTWHEISDNLAKAFTDKFDIDLLVGFGCPELGAGISINTPNVRATGFLQKGKKTGSVGSPLPSVAVKVVDEKTMEPCQAFQTGCLMVKSQSRMMHYWREPVSDRLFIENWYLTTYTAYVDDEGFIFLKNRDLLQ